MKKFLEKKWLTLVYGFLLIAVGALTLTYAIINPTNPKSKNIQQIIKIKSDKLLKIF